MTVLIIDNFDSFVYNLSRYINELHYQTLVVRNNAITLFDIEKINPSHIIISPGPCDPNKSGISIAVIEKFYNRLPILGVCLGHQAIGQVFGSMVMRGKKPVHGKSSLIKHDQKEIFKNIANPLQVGRYHSLIVSEHGLDNEIVINATSEDNEIMALRHKHFPVYGLQFHPESIMTAQGHQLLNNFLVTRGIDEFTN
jgi:anthranilate synthase/aminodeoxychorismate synthase-like glutamine amidotransferase